MAFSGYFCQNYVVYVVGNTEAPGYFGQLRHRFGPNNGFVVGWQVQIAHLDRQITFSGDK